MFESLQERLGSILNGLTGRGALSEADVSAALREVRRALLEADVALDVVRSFTDRVREKAVGAAVLKSIKPGQMVVKIVHDELVEMLGSEGTTIDLNAPAPVVVMMVGLQGSGKTTTTAKIAKRLDERQNKKSPDGLARYAPAGRAGAAAPARRAGEGRDAADRRRPDAGRDRQARRAGRQARRPRRGDPRHRRPHPYRRAADGRDGRDQAGVEPARDPAGRRLADRPGRRQPRRRASTSASASPA